MVRPSPAGSHSPSYGCHASQAGRAGQCRAVHALASALAACRTGRRDAGRALNPRSAAPVAGIRDSGECMGAPGPQSPHCRLSPHPATLEASDGTSRRRVIPTSVAPITFFVREDADWMIAHPALEHAHGLSPVARTVLEFLRLRGASFFADIVRSTGKLKAEIETGLWELVAAGLVTADDFDNLRSLIDPKRRAGQGSARLARPRHSAGRWTILYTDSAIERERDAEATCWMMLNRYGVVFRDLLARESNLPIWRELQLAFRRLEARGEIRCGRFVDGFLGEQFALPVAVESLRATRKLSLTGEMVTLSAADPLNLVGIIVPGERVPAISGKVVSYRDGEAVPAETEIESRVAAI